MENPVKLSEIGEVTTEDIIKTARISGTPAYLTDESIIRKKGNAVLSMPNAFGLKARYAMKANSNKAILQIINELGLHIDASSLNEARRAHMAGIEHKKIMLTTQEVPVGWDRTVLEDLIEKGLKYNVCSLRQLELIGDFASEKGIPLSMRIHPGMGGSGESATRDTASKYSCFGVHLTDIETALEFAESKDIIFDEVHVHIGSGGDPEKWRQNIDRELGILEKYFPDAETVNFGGGLREARMPDETPAEIQDLGKYAKEKIEEFYKKTGRKLVMEVEPGTYIVANSGYLVTKVIDKKQTGPDGFKFIVLDGGMEVNTRPLLYGSEHPFYVVSKEGELLSSEFDWDSEYESYIVVGRCCESGDSQTIDSQENFIPRKMAEPEIGDYVVIGGTGAYCSAMAPFNYNSHLQAPEFLLREDGTLDLIRKLQSLEQMIENEEIITSKELDN